MTAIVDGDNHLAGICTDGTSDALDQRSISIEAWYGTL